MLSSTHCGKKLSSARLWLSEATARADLLVAHLIWTLQVAFVWVQSNNARLHAFGLRGIVADFHDRLHTPLMLELFLNGWRGGIILFNPVQRARRTAFHLKSSSETATLIAPVGEVSYEIQSNIV